MCRAGEGGVSTAPRSQPAPDNLETLQAEARRVVFDLATDRERLRRIARRLEALPVEATAEQPWLSPVTQNRPLANT